MIQRNTNQRRSVSYPADLPLPAGTLRRLEQIYVNQDARYASVKTALTGVLSAVQKRHKFQEDSASAILRGLDLFMGKSRKKANWQQVLSHFIVGHILIAAKASAKFTSHGAYMRWARQHMSGSRGDQTLLNFRNIAKLGPVAIKYANMGVKAVIELHYMFHYGLKKKNEETLAATGSELTDAQQHEFRTEMQDQLGKYLETYTRYAPTNADPNEIMRTAMDAALTHHRLVTVAQIPESVVTMDHALMIALFKGFSMEVRDALSLAKMLAERASTLEEMKIVFDKWVSNRMAFVDADLFTYGQVLPMRLSEFISRFIAIPERGRKHFQEEIKDLAAGSSLAKNSVLQAYRILRYIAYKADISLEEELVTTLSIMRVLLHDH